MLLLTAFVFGVSLFVSSIAVLYTDFVEFYQVMVQALFFLTPIIYPVPHATWAATLIKLNPVTPLLRSIACRRNVRLGVKAQSVHQTSPPWHAE